ncbi:SPOSA6832_01258 [Sporobolomyces salmonicolor]|uniref:SPOSA6832_01258-mRNA-1:cds n=1 Tax=Sporidiobolus salmonicolor TaxID=5005 RepID=A0A0D6EIL0_SPOSA|nr:SPOSA6832_01258 [Sporobolomyces salmonicolor]
MSNGACFALCLFFFPETHIQEQRPDVNTYSRGEVILRKRCKALAAETGRPHYVEGADVFEGWFEAIKISCARPLLYLFTEPIVTALALWVGFAWGMVFLFIGSIGQGGTVLICGFIGAFIGCLTNIFIQDPLFRRQVVQGGGKAKPEVRLYSSAVGSSCFCFGWTARPWIHWIVPCIFISLANVGIYTIYLATYSYSATFPFFGVIMYDNLGFPVASTVVGAIAAAFIVVPWTLIFFGERLRAHSKIAIALSHQEGEILSEEPDVHAQGISIA